MYISPQVLFDIQRQNLKRQDSGPQTKGYCNYDIFQYIHK